MRIGILGGTFNPIHNGHLRLAEGARRKIKLDKVIFVPVNIPPHKPPLDVIAAKERYKMVYMAIRNKPHFEISDYEIKTGGTSYSIKTLKAFRKRFGQKTKLFFLTGSDSLPMLKAWKNIKKVLELAEFVVASRPGYKMFRPAFKVRKISIPTPDISSTFIRKSFQSGLSVKRFLPDIVYNYINKKGFYK